MRTMTCTVTQFSIYGCVLPISILQTGRSRRRKQKWRGRCSSRNKQDKPGARTKENGNKDKGGETGRNTTRTIGSTSNWYETKEKKTMLKKQGESMNKKKMHVDFKANIVDFNANIVC